MVNLKVFRCLDLAIIHSNVFFFFRVFFWVEGEVQNISLVLLGGTKFWGDCFGWVPMFGGVFSK